MKSAPKNFIGRKKELLQLADLLGKSNSSLVVCKGRRRIGKSRLIQEFGKMGKQFLEFQGLAPGPNIGKEEQLKNFSEQLSVQTGLPSFNLENWTQALALLAAQIKSRKTVILIDEISWMADGSPDLPGKLKIAWDTKFSKSHNLVLVLCGSVTSWLDDNILNNADFVGRLSLVLELQPLSLGECDLFWGSRRNRVKAMEKLRILSVTGGIPRYLEEIDPKQTAEQNIKSLCFDASGMLFAEFDRIFNSIFSRRAAIYRAIVSTLTDRKLGMKEISEQIGVLPSGTISKYLRDLENSGFIREEKFWKFSGKKSRLSRYAIKDNYLRFFLKYIEPQQDKIRRGLFALKSLENLPGWRAISGLQFETLVLGNLAYIMNELGISVDNLVNAAPYIQTETKRKKGCQIDLLLETRFATLYVCEIKFRSRITSSIIGEVKGKIAKLKTPCNYSIRPILIYAGELDEELLYTGYFDKCVDMTKLLG